MIYSISYSKDIDKVLKKWKKSNPVLFKKYSKILEELMLHPREGLGHPEALVKGNSIRWSRHITAHDRIVYNIYDEIVVVEVIQSIKSLRRQIEAGLTSCFFLGSVSQND